MRGIAFPRAAASGLALLAGLLLAACDEPAEFSAPLSEPGSAAYDERLIGTWYAVEGEESEGSAALAVIEPGENGTLNGAFSYMVVEPGAEGGTGFLWVNRSAHATLLDGQIYYNTQALDGDLLIRETGEARATKERDLFASSPNRGFWILRADIDTAGLLTLKVLSKKRAKRHGLPERTLSCGTGCDFDLYEATPAELAEMIRSEEPGELFSIDLGPFMRIGP